MPRQRAANAAQTRWIAYFRVSTNGQEQSGLGLEAQQHAVADYLRRAGGSLVARFVEVESGRRKDRPELRAALAACRVHQARLLVSKIDRLSRDAALLLSLRDAGVEFVAADCPDANRMTVSILAAVAENEADAISQRTRDALAAAKRRGVQLGTSWRNNFDDSGRAQGRQAAKTAIEAAAEQRAVDRAPHVARLRASGLATPAELAMALNRDGVPAMRGGAWSAIQVRRLLARLDRAG